MSDIDEISRMIGEMSANQREHMRQQTALFDKFDRMNEEQIEHRGALKLLGSQVAEVKMATAASDLKIKNLAEEHAEVKNKGKGLVIGLGLLGGGGGLAGFLTAAKSFITGSGHG